MKNSPKNILYQPVSILFAFVLLIACLGTIVLWKLIPDDNTALSSMAEEATREVRSFVSVNEVLRLGRNEESEKKGKLERSRCTFRRCFDIGKCRKSGLKVYVYPEEGRLSEVYRSFLKVIRESKYYTENPDEACLFVLGIDTLSRDVLSEYYVSNLDSAITNNKLLKQWWNNGENHLIFNLYSGTYPNYTENDLGFDYGYAILAKASMSEQAYRDGFDISLPLIKENWPISDSQPAFHHTGGWYFGVQDKFLLSFKGKRYLYGVGRETRNDLFFLHNAKDVILVTTCKHGKFIPEYNSPRCRAEESEFNKYDFQQLIKNSTFCLIPRGRRLGSYRLLEVIQSNCVGVSVSQDLVLPFQEIIDWKQAIFVLDERIILEMPEYLLSNLLLPNLRGINMELRLMRMRQHAALVWDRYFSSTKKIIETTLEIIESRLNLLENIPQKSIKHYNTPSAVISPSASSVFQASNQLTEKHPLLQLPVITSNNFTVVIKITVSPYETPEELIDMLDVWR